MISKIVIFTVCLKINSMCAKPQHKEDLRVLDNKQNVIKSVALLRQSGPQDKWIKAWDEIRKKSMFDPTEYTEIVPSPMESQTSKKSQVSVNVDKTMVHKEYQERRRKFGPRVRYRGIGGIVDAATGGVQNIIGTISDVNDEGFFGFRGGVGNIIGSVLRLANVGLDLVNVIVNDILAGRDIFGSRESEFAFKYDTEFE